MTFDDIYPEQKISLECIRHKKNALKKQLETHRERINQSFYRVISPAVDGEDRIFSIINSISKSLATLDMMRTGFRIIKKVTSYFFRKR